MSHTAWIWILFLPLANFASLSKSRTFFESRLIVYYMVCAMCSHTPLWFFLVLVQAETCQKSEEWADSKVPNSLRSLQRACLGWATARHTMELWSRRGCSLHKWRGNGVSVPRLTLLPMSSSLHWLMPLCAHKLLVPQ